MADQDPMRPPLLVAIAEGTRAGAVAYAAATLVFGWLGVALMVLPVRGIGAAIGPLGGTLVMLAGGAFLFRPPRRWSLITVGVAGSGMLLIGFTWYAATLWLPPIAAHTTATFGLSLAKVGVIAFTAAIGGRAAGAAAIAASLAVESISIWVGLEAGYPWSFDVYTVVAAVIIVVGALGLRNELPRSLLAEVLVSRTVVDESQRHIREAARSQVAAIVHDTVLNDLAVLATSVPGPLSGRLRERLSSTVALLSSPDWASDAPPTSGAEPARRLLIRAVEDARANGLDVELTGFVELLDTLDPDTERALGGAVAQCLENTRRHANTDSAEVSVLGGDAELSVMVSDGGDGFDPDEVVGDRMGLRESVLSRVGEAGGTVRIFARPGFGTSVLISVPVRGIAGER